MIFGKDGTKERRYGQISPSIHDDANINLYMNACEPIAAGAVIAQCE